MDRHARSDLFSNRISIDSTVAVCFALDRRLQTLEREIYGASANTELHAAVVAHLQMKIAGDRGAWLGVSTPPQLLFAPFGLQQAIDSGRTNPQQLFFGGGDQSQLTELLELSDLLWHGGH